MVGALLIPAIAEWFCESFIDDKTHSDPYLCQHDSPVPTELLFSDIHIDTWDSSYRGRNFQRLIGAARKKGYTGFILNGDLMDFPLNGGGGDRMTVEANSAPIEQGVLNPVIDPVFAILSRLRASGYKRVLYIGGNHDVGIEGLRYVRSTVPAPLPQISWNPFIMVTATPDGTPLNSKIFLEHGQHYDAALWLYIRTAAFDILKWSPQKFERETTNRTQRSGRTGTGLTNQRAGKASAGTPPAVPVPKFRPTISDPYANGNPPTWGFDPNDPNSTRLDLSPIQKIVRNRYRFAARMFFHRSKGSMGTMTMGHIHVPDRYIFRNGQVYINTGTWSANCTFQTFCIVKSCGCVLGPYQWRDGVEHLL